MSESRTFRPSRVGVIGGGTAGLLTALSLKEYRPELEVDLVASSAIPVIGVGEATTPPIVPFLHGFLGLDPHRFEREVQPTWKLGIRFEWGAPDPWYFNYAFGDGDLSDAQRHDGHPLRYSSTSQFMSADKAPLVSLGGRVVPLLKQTRFAYHLDNERLVAFLTRRAREVGVRLVDATILHVATAHGEVTHLDTDRGPLGYDLNVDCTGFRSMLLGNALHVPFIDFASSLTTDRAVTAVRKNDGRPRPYTTATTMNAGWCWQIPMRDEDHLGYVFSSRFLGEDQAREELARRFPGVHDFKVVRFRSGRRRDFVAGNVVAVGNSYGFVEPLESTAIHMIIIEISRLLALLGSGGHGVAQTNAQMGAHWDWLRWFLAVHYRFNRRLDTPFWREVHVGTDWSGLEPTFHDFMAHGPLSARKEPPRLTGDVVFGPRGLDVMLLGQKVVPETLPASTTKAEWDELAAMRQRMVDLALPHGEALAKVADDRSIFEGLVHDEDSWCRQMTLEMQRFAPTRGRSQDALHAWASTHGISHTLGRDAARMPDEFPASPNIDFGKFLKRVPAIVLRPKDQAQLAECLQTLTRRRIPMKVRGAGHSSGGQTLIEDGAVLDLRWLKRVIHDSPEEQRIRVEAGLWWLELCGHLQPQNRRPLVLTDNWRSTVGGTLAVGGFGDASHREGLQLAGVRELTVMTLDGTRHRARPGDELFDWSLAGRGQLGVVTEVLLDTVSQSSMLTAKVLAWRTLEDFLRDARRICAEGRFDWLRARMMWTPGAPVAAAAGHLGGAVRGADFTELSASQSPSETLDLFARSTEEPDERWQLGSPSVELVFPIDEAGTEAMREVHRRVVASGLHRYLTRGSSVMVLSGRDAVRFPMAPLPAHDLCAMLAIRPEVPTPEVERFLPTLDGLSELALAAGGKVYAMSVEPTRADWLALQLGPERFATLRSLKLRHDPDHLLNPWHALPPR